MNQEHKTEDLGVETSLCQALAKKLTPVVREHERRISSGILDGINESWGLSREGHSSALGEEEEAVSGILENSETSGNPDGVVRLTSLCDTCLKAQLIIEVSVDNNGGEKKIGQAFDYASLIKDQGKTALLLTFHVHRNKSKVNSAGLSKLKIIQEAFIYLHSETEDERKMGFLWREVYEQGAEEKDFDFLCKSSEGIARCLNCAQANRDTEVTCSITQWEVVSDNVAISEGFVYKIFDNRFYPTYRRLDQWWDNKLPWIKSLGGVEIPFSFSESSDINALDALRKPEGGSPEGRKRSHSQTAYPKGSICIIKYKRVNGTHYASQASHFLDIATCISEMHERDIVHGDIRGFNMLHPYSRDKNITDGIKKSLLIDFDFSGQPGRDKYPPGYSEQVVDNNDVRSGKAGEEMQKVDDWKDLGSAIGCYEINEESLRSLAEFKELRKKWEKIWDKFRKEGIAGLELLRNFIKNNNDPKIEVLSINRTKMENVLCKGTGSPNKLIQKTRRSVTTNSHT